MRLSPSRHEVAFSGLAGLTGVAGSFAVAGWSRRFIVAPIDDLVVRSTPGVIVSWTIVNLGDTGHLLHIGLSAVLAIGLLAGAALLALLTARRLGRPLVAPVLAGPLAWGLTVAITTDPLLGLGSAIPVAAFTAACAIEFPPSAYDPARRQALLTGASAAALVSTAIGIAVGISGGIERGGPATDASDAKVDEDIRPLLQREDEQSLDFAGDNLPGLVSSISEFYNVDINQFDPDVRSNDWSLTLKGTVEDQISIGFAELTAMPTEHRYITLRCVGESLNGRKMDTAVWTGTPIAPLLEAADPQGTCGCAMLRAVDGYFVQFPVAALENAFLAWRMNGRPLPRAHGHPVRVLVPGHWGETNVKWLAEIELLDEEMDGYWEQRGWEGTGPVNTVAKLWDTTRLDDGRIELAGHAYAGTRGIERVEVSVDGGTTWSNANLSVPLPGDDVWRQWRYVFEPAGSNEVVVRAVDGTGNLQSRERSDAFPSGATGWVTQTVRS